MKLLIIKFIRHMLNHPFR